MNNTFIIIPCYNEEENIKEVLKEIKIFYDSFNMSNFQIIVINDCSTDNTLKTAKEISDIKVLDLPINLGIGGAVQTGFLYSESENASYAIKIDGDGQHDPNNLKDLLIPLIEDNADIVIGSRFLDNNKGFKSTFLRRIGIKILQFFCILLTGKRITDPTSGYRAYNKKAIKFMTNNYPSFDYPEPEEVILAIKNDLRIVEVPTIMRERKKGKSSIAFYGSIYYMIKVILSMIFTKLRGKERKINK